MKKADIKRLWLKIKKRKWLIPTAILILFSASLVFIVPARLVGKSQNYSYALYDKNGILLGGQVAEDEQWRFAPTEVPEKFKKAIITYEDKRFYFHCGIDLLSIARAIKLNLNQQRIVSGGSTLTMQTIRLLENHPKRTYTQKIKEAFISVLFEIRYTKKHILQLYCANAPFGGNVVGLEAASWRYFNRPPSELTWAETATLAVLPNQPSLVYPGANSEILLEKRNFLLQKLYQKKYFDEKTYELSLAESLPSKPFALPSNSPHYLEFLKQTHKKNQTKFYTTIDYNIQKNTLRIIDHWSSEFSRRGISNAAVLILDTETKDVLAYCGNSGDALRNPDSWKLQPG